MDPGEQITGTRDEYYDLISVLYHALHGADSCDTYALDAEATGRADIAGYFQEARTAYVRMAEQAKEMLGIPEAMPEPEIPPEDVSPSSENVPPTTGVPGTTLAGDVSSGVPQVVTNRIAPEDFDRTNAVLRSGVEDLTLERALEEIDGWELKLEESNDPELAPIAENLRQLRSLLTADDIDGAAIGESMSILGAQVREVASGELGAGVAGELRQLGELLDAEGRSISGQA